MMLNNKFIKKKILFSLKEESNSISILFEILIIIAKAINNNDKAAGFCFGWNRPFVGIQSKISQIQCSCRISRLSFMPMICYYHNHE